MHHTQKNRAIAIVASAALLAALALWQIFTTHESDIYHAAFGPQLSGNVQFVTNPMTCGATTSSATGVSPELLSNFLRENTNLGSPNTIYPNGDVPPTTEAHKLGFVNNKNQVALHVSHVGFSNGKNEALFCAVGLDIGLFHLKFIDNQWQVVSFITLAMS